MRIIDILNQTANLLSLTDELEMLKTATKENEAETLKNVEINKMLSFVNLTLHELCVNYVPVLNVCEANVKNKSFEISKLSNFLRLHNIKKDGKIVDYKIFNKTICFEEDGVYLISYYTYPQIKSLFDELDFLSNLSPDVLVYGLTSFYCLSKSMFDEFKIYNEKYRSRAEAIKNLKVFELPKRIWL